MLQISDLVLDYSCYHAAFATLFKHEGAEGPPEASLGRTASTACFLDADRLVFEHPYVAVNLSLQDGGMEARASRVGADQIRDGRPHAPYAALVDPFYLPYWFEFERAHGQHVVLFGEYRERDDSVAIADPSEAAPFAGRVPAAAAIDAVSASWALAYRVVPSTEGSSPPAHAADGCLRSWLKEELGRLVAALGRLRDPGGTGSEATDQDLHSLLTGVRTYAHTLRWHSKYRSYACEEDAAESYGTAAVLWKAIHLTMVRSTLLRDDDRSEKELRYLVDQLPSLD